MFFGADEDAYWERVREERENPKRRPYDEWESEPEYESANLYLEDDMSDLEDEWDCQMAELSESDLMDIVKEYLGIKTESARWDPKRLCINYTYQTA